MSQPHSIVLVKRVACERLYVDMLEGLDDINWSEHYMAYGTATVQGPGWWMPCQLSDKGVYHAR